MTADLHDLIDAIHAAPARAGLVVTGGGSLALAWLLSAPGASATVLEAVIPYSAGAMAEYLGETPARFVSAETAARLATVARERALALADGGAAVLGVACTAALASLQPKRGDHGAWVAVASDTGVAAWLLQLEKGARSRADEEEAVAELLIRGLAHAAGVLDEVRLALGSGDRLCPPTIR